MAYFKAHLSPAITSMGNLTWKLICEYIARFKKLITSATAIGYQRQKARICQVVRDRVILAPCSCGGVWQ